MIIQRKLKCKETSYCEQTDNTKVENWVYQWHTHKPKENTVQCSKYWERYRCKHSSKFPCKHKVVNEPFRKLFQLLLRNLKSWQLEVIWAQKELIIDKWKLDFHHFGCNLSSQNKIPYVPINWKSKQSGSVFHFRMLKWKICLNGKYQPRVEKNIMKPAEISTTLRLPTRVNPRSPAFSLK